MGVKTRIIPCLLWNEHGAVKGQQFKQPGRRIGGIRDRVRLLEQRNIDELIILDICATPNNRSPRFDEVKQLTQDLFMPVTIGGGIRNVSDISRLLASGADKVAINTAAIEHPDLIDRAARQFGSQAIVVSIDVNGSGCVYSHCGQKDTRLDPVIWAQEAERRGAGELLLTAIGRDGTMDGYELGLVQQVAGATDIPVIAAGGCGSYQDMAAVLQCGAHAVAVGAAFQFLDLTPKGASRYLHEQGIATRL